MRKWSSVPPAGLYRGPRQSTTWSRTSSQNGGRPYRIFSRCGASLSTVSRLTSGPSMQVNLPSFLLQILFLYTSSTQISEYIYSIITGGSLTHSRVIIMSFRIMLPLVPRPPQAAAVLSAGLLKAAGCRTRQSAVAAWSGRGPDAHCAGWRHIGGGSRVPCPPGTGWSLHFCRTETWLLIVLKAVVTWEK